MRFQDDQYNGGFINAGEGISLKLSKNDNDKFSVGVFEEFSYTGNFPVEVSDGEISLMTVPKTAKKFSGMVKYFTSNKEFKPLTRGHRLVKAVAKQEKELLATI